MKYKLMKDLPMAKEGTIVLLEQENEGLFYIKEEDDCAVGYILKKDINEWLEPIVEKNIYDDLEVGDKIWYIHDDGYTDYSQFRKKNCRSETFITREEAEDEHKRREWAVRKGKFVPGLGEQYFFYCPKLGIRMNKTLLPYAIDYLLINSGLAFRTHEECQDAIDNHDIIRLFYTIR